MKLEDLMLKTNRTRAEDEQLRNQVRFLQQQAQRKLPGAPDVYSKSEINRLLGDIRKLIVPAAAPQWYPLMTSLTNTGWDGDSFSSTVSPTELPLSATFGVPSGCKMVLFYVAYRDSGSAASDTTIYFSPNNTTGTGVAAGAFGAGNDKWVFGMLPVPCNQHGNVFYEIAASGVATFDVTLQVWAYYR